MFRRKWIKYLLLVVLTYLVLREVLPFQISYYSAETNHRSSMNSNSTSFGHGVRQDLIDLDVNPNYRVEINGLFGNSSFTELNQNTIDVDIQKNLYMSSARFIPLYKNVRFSCSISYYWDAGIKINNRVKYIDEQGSIQINGTQKVSGICSGQTVENLINNLIYKEAQEDILKSIDGQINKLKQDD